MEWSRKWQALNKRLEGWCRHRNLGFFDHGSVSLAPGLMTADGSHPSLKGKRIPAQELAGLIERALSQV